MMNLARISCVLAMDGRGGSQSASPLSARAGKAKAQARGSASLIKEKFGVSPERDGAERSRDCCSIFENWVRGKGGCPRSEGGTRCLAGPDWTAGFAVGNFGHSAGLPL